MKAIVLAAGQGSRLRPHTNDRPKCMVELAGRPILHRQIDVLRQAGIGDITVVGGYRSEQIETPGVSVLLNPKYSQTNMVSTLFCAADRMVPGEDLLITYGDIVFEQHVLEAVLRCEGEIALGADREWRRLWEFRMEDPLADAETFKFDKGNRVIELGKRPESYDDVQAQYMGLIRVCGDKVQEFMSSYESMDRSQIYDGKDFDNMYMTSFLQHLIDTGWNVHAALVNNGWLEVDTAEELDTYNAMYASGELKSIVNLGASRD